MPKAANSTMTVPDRIYGLQLAQLEHDEKYHKDVVIMPLAERIKHMALHNAKYTGYFVDAVDTADTGRIQGILTDAFIITLATANTLNQDLGEAIKGPADAASLAAMGASLANELDRNADDGFGFVKAYARQAHGSEVRLTGVNWTILY